MDKKELTQELVRFNNSDVVKSLQDTYSSKSFFDILEITRDELGHSHVIKWLFLLDNLPCSWRHYPIMSFLDLIIRNAENQNKAIDKNLADSILLRDAIVSVDNIELEKTTTGVTATNDMGDQSKGRIDILIECSVIYKDNDQEINKKLKICIENKVDSSEHDLQTWKYYAYLAGKEAMALEKEKFEMKEEKDITSFCQRDNDNTKICYNVKSYDYNKDDEKQLFVFLTPQVNEQVTCPHFIIVTYQELMDNVLIKLSKQKNLLPKDKLFLEEYMNALSIPFIDEKNDKEMPILAIREEDEKRLCDFYEENIDLIEEIVKDVYNLEDNKNEKCEIFWKNNGRFIKNALNAYVIVEKRKNADKTSVPTKAEILLGITKRNGNRPSWIWIKKDDNYKKYETLIDAVKEIVSFLLKNKNGDIKAVNDYLECNNVIVNPKPVLYNDDPGKISGRPRYTSFIYGDCTYYVSTQWGAKDPQKDNFFKLVNLVNTKFSRDISVLTNVEALKIVNDNNE